MQKWGEDAKNKVGMDSYTFCTALGPEEANRQLRRHWRTWVNESHIAHLASIGVNTVRIPVGDWMYEPYEPYIGCWDGAVEELDRVLHYLKKYGMKAVLDVHAVKGSANGLDNGGQSMDVIWSTDAVTGDAHFVHWDVRSANWIGNFNITTMAYDSINYDNIEHTVMVFEKIVRRYRNISEVIGLEPGKCDDPT